MRHLPEDMENLRSTLARNLRELRRSRRWSQREVAEQIGLSQSRLSQIERGDGSFTAEQLIKLIQLFNVSIDDVLPNDQRDQYETQLQNALARFGASHLRTNDSVPPTGELGDIQSVIRAALISGRPRLITALAPVVVQNVDDIDLQLVSLRLAESGFSRRLPWLAENILEAVRREQVSESSRTRLRRLRRAELLLDNYVALTGERGTSGGAEDLLDRDVRSKKTLTMTRRALSDISKKWGITTSLQPVDFRQALAAAT
jgi:transcriptional regulator with XRE-family HTH domain